MGRLTLSTVGIKSPVDVASDPDVPQSAAKGPEAANGQQAAPKAQPRRSRPTQTRTPPTSRPGAGAEPKSRGGAPFYGSGRPLQTSIGLDEECVQRLEQLARAARVSVNPLAVAALQAGLPAHSDAARAAIVDERVRRAGLTPARVERNFRLPKHLRARIDELTAAARERLPRATRADLVNAALRRGLPDEAQRAAELVSEHARRLEREVAAGFRR